MKQPNILIINTHDSGRHFSCYGAPTVNTPAIDRLAAEGVQFNRMFAASPICSPSRGALLTGQYPQQNGLVGLTGGQQLTRQWEFTDYTRHLSHRLHDAGYYTAMFGLQDETSHIDRLGFDDTTCHGTQYADGSWKPATAVAEEAANFLRNHNHDRPFYAQVGFFETHTPYTRTCEPDDTNGTWIPPYAKSHEWAPWKTILKRFGATDDEQARQHIAELQGALKQVDNAVALLMQSLRDTGQENNTLVLFTVDHGVELPGAKWTMFDSGLGIAFIMRWPDGNVTGGRQCDWLLGNIDFLPTLYELTGLERPDDLQGISFADACRKDTANSPSPREYCYGNWLGGLNFSVRSQRYKLIRHLQPNPTGRKCPPYELYLYDLELDPLELTNVAMEPAYADIRDRMSKELDAWLQNVQDTSVEHIITGNTHDEMVACYVHLCREPKL